MNERPAQILEPVSKNPKIGAHCAALACMRARLAYMQVLHIRNLHCLETAVIRVYYQILIAWYIFNHTFITVQQSINICCSYVKKSFLVPVLLQEPHTSVHGSCAGKPQVLPLLSSLAGSTHDRYSVLQQLPRGLCLFQCCQNWWCVRYRDIKAQIFLSCMFSEISGSLCLEYVYNKYTDLPNEIKLEACGKVRA